MTVRCPWLFRVMNRRHIKPLIPDAAYYWLLDRLSDNDGWRPLPIRMTGAPASRQCPAHPGNPRDRHGRVDVLTGESA